MMTARARSRTSLPPGRRTQGYSPRRARKEQTRAPSKTGPRALIPPAGASPLDASPGTRQLNAAARCAAAGTPEPVAAPPSPVTARGCQEGCTLCRNGTVLRTRTFVPSTSRDHDRASARPSGCGGAASNAIWLPSGENDGYCRRQWARIASRMLAGSPSGDQRRCPGLPPDGECACRRRDQARPPLPQTAAGGSSRRSPAGVPPLAAIGLDRRRRRRRRCVEPSGDQTGTSGTAPAARASSADRRPGERRSAASPSRTCRGRTRCCVPSGLNDGLRGRSCPIWLGSPSSVTRRASEPSAAHGRDVTRQARAEVAAEVADAV